MWSVKNNDGKLELWFKDKYLGPCEGGYFKNEFIPTLNEFYANLVEFSELSHSARKKMGKMSPSEYLEMFKGWVYYKCDGKNYYKNEILKELEDFADCHKDSFECIGFSVNGFVYSYAYAGVFTDIRIERKDPYQIYVNYLNNDWLIASTTSSKQARILAKQLVKGYDLLLSACNDYVDCNSCCDCKKCGYSEVCCRSSQLGNCACCEDLRSVYKDIICAVLNSYVIAPKVAEYVYRKTGVSKEDILNVK